MVIKSLDARMMQKAFLAGAKGLEAKKEWINELNVFPVPDGDTGTNMTMTIMAAAKEVAALEDPTMEALCKAISSGSLRGARGNSGVILSQLFRGFTKEIKDTPNVTTTVLANAFVRGTETAYKAVMKPKEGTILTVSRGMAEKAIEIVSRTDDIVEFLTIVIEHGDYVLSQTPEMLPVLKQAGVVDSGGQGLMQVMKGVLDGILGKEVELDVTPAAAQPDAEILTEFKGQQEIHFGYCTEFIINVEKSYDETAEHNFKGYLEKIGDSIVVVSDEDVIKVHVHTNDPGLAIQKALTYGSLSRIKIDNMREEHEERLIKDAQKIAAAQKASQTEQSPSEQLPAKKSQTEEPDHIICQDTSDTPDEEPQGERKPFGFIAVSVGEGLGEIFRGIGADYLIEGGQTMNPSTEDVLNAIARVNADTVFVLPNNKNIILAARQAQTLVEDKKVYVIPSTTVPQGITAIINFVPDLSAEENMEIMNLEMERVKTGQVTYAVRNTTVDDMQINEGDIMGIGDSGMLAVGQEIGETTLATIRAMMDPDSELITIYHGSDVAKQDADELLKAARKEFPDCEIELHDGGQPVYYYLISVE